MEREPSSTRMVQSIGGCLRWGRLRGRVNSLKLISFATMESGRIINHMGKG